MKVWKDPGKPVLSLYLFKSSHQSRQRLEDFEAVRKPLWTNECLLQFRFCICLFVRLFRIFHLVSQRKRRCFVSNKVFLESIKWSQSLLFLFYSRKNRRRNVGLHVSTEDGKKWNILNIFLTQLRLILYSHSQRWLEVSWFTNILQVFLIELRLITSSKWFRNFL